MRKIVIRIFNFIYIAGCVFAMLGFLIKPLASVNISISVPVSEVVSLISKDDDLLKTPKVHREDSNKKGFNIKDYLTAENLEKEGVKSLDLTFPIEIVPENITTYFDLKNNYKIIHDGIFGSIDNILDNTFDYAKNLIKVTAKLVATGTVKDKVIEQITDKLEETSDTAKALYDKYKCGEKVDSIVENVLDKFEEGYTPVSDLAREIMGDKNEEGHYTDGVKGILESLKEEPEFEGKITDKVIEELQPETISEAINVAIEEMPEIAEKIEVLDENGDPVLDEEGNPKTEYVIKDLNSALLALLEKLPGLNQTIQHQEQNSSSEEEHSEQSEEHIEEEENEKITYKIVRLENKETTDEELREKLKSFILTKLPFDLENLDYSLHGYMPYILLGVIVLGILPWFLFLIVTIIRTCRKKKCWTKPWIVFVFAFLEVIFGIGLTITLKFAPKVVGSIFGDRLGSNAWLLEGIDVTFKTAAFWASIVYLVMIPLTIAYVIICHKVKREYKQEKKEAKKAKKAEKVQESA